MTTANATKAAAVAIARLKARALVKPGNVTRFTGVITCYTDPATGLVAGFQLGAAAPVCSTDGTARSVTIPADGAIVGVVAAVDPKTALLASLTLAIESASGPASIVTCGGSAAGVPVPALPKLAALSNMTAGCAPLPAAGRRRALAAGVAVDAASLVVTAAPPGSPGGASGPVTLLSNLISTAAQLNAGAVGVGGPFPGGATFTTGAAAATVNTLVLPLSYTTAAGSCTASIRTTAGSPAVPTSTIVGTAVTQPVPTQQPTTTLVSFTGLGAALAASTTYAFVVDCTSIMYWMSTGSPQSTFTGAFTPGDIALYQQGSWATGNPIALYGVQFQMTT